MSKRIGALWLRTTKDGKQYMSGVLEGLAGDINIAVFKNDRKEKDNHPDYQIVRSDPRPEAPPPRDDFFNQDTSDQEPTVQVDAGPAEAPQPTQAKPRYTQQGTIEYPTESINPSDIPF